MKLGTRLRLHFIEKGNPVVLHSSFIKNQKILIIKKNGEQVVARYLDSKSGKLFTDHGVFEKKNIRSSTIYRKR